MCSEDGSFVLFRHGRINARNRWVIADLCGEGGRIRTVAVPMWVKHGIDAWPAAEKIKDGAAFRTIWVLAHIR